MRRWLIALALFSALGRTITLDGQSTTLPASRPIPVYVTSVGAQNGFTDPSKDNQDTVKDLRDNLRGRRGIVLTEKREDAKIVLVVLGREKAQVTNGFLGPARDVVMRVKFSAGSIETDLTASAQGGVISSGGAWSKAARKIASQVEDWVKANGAKLQ